MTVVVFFEGVHIAIPMGSHPFEDWTPPGNRKSIPDVLVTWILISYTRGSDNVYAYRLMHVEHGKCSIDTLDCPVPGRIPSEVEEIVHESVPWYPSKARRILPPQDGFVDTRNKIPNEGNTLHMIPSGERDTRSTMHLVLIDSWFGCVCLWWGF